jgi:hypothetical protein
VRVEVVMHEHVGRSIDEGTDGREHRPPCAAFIGKPYFAASAVSMRLMRAPSSTTRAVPSSQSPRIEPLALHAAARSLGLFFRTRYGRKVGVPRRHLRLVGAGQMRRDP